MQDWKPQTPSGTTSVVHWLGKHRQKTIEILSEGVWDFLALHLIDVRYHMSFTTTNRLSETIKLESRTFYYYVDITLREEKNNDGMSKL